MKLKNSIAIAGTRRLGFSLIELLIVVAIILIIAAIAIPNLLRARLSANEASAASSVRQITRAEVAYSIAYPAVGYAPSLAELGGPMTGCSPSPTSSCILDYALISGQKSGYNLLATGIAGSGGTNNTFVVGAAPMVFNKTGTRDFCATTEAVLRARTVATGNLPISTIAACSLLTAVQ
jgi:type IV pilus assembly protein PilA